jgi:transcription antitermination factor NusA-like protein
MVCAPSREICDKTKCCITEIEEQQEKQATLFGTRSFKRFLKRLLDGDEE